MGLKAIDCVMVHGPANPRMFQVLVAIAAHADDFGFAFPSVQTIAAKCAGVDARTVLRTLDALEREGWLVVRRRVLPHYRANGGRGNAYLMNVQRLRLGADASARRNDLHEQIEARRPTIFAGADLHKTEKPSDAFVEKLIVVERRIETEQKTVFALPDLHKTAKPSDTFAEKPSDTFGQSQVTKMQKPSDTFASPILINKN